MVTKFIEHNNDVKAINQDYYLTTILADVDSHKFCRDLLMLAQYIIVMPDMINGHKIHRT